MPSGGPGGSQGNRGGRHGAPQPATIHTGNPNPHRGGGRGQGGRGRRRGASVVDEDQASGAALVDPAGDAAEPADRTQQAKQKRKRKEEANFKLDCTICAEDHYTSKCPQLKGPKPSVSYCGATSDGLGFFCIQAARPFHTVPMASANVFALITVEEGAVSAELLKSELARVIPVRWDWAVQEHGVKAFLVPFPSKVELDRMVAIRTFITKNKEGVLIFEEFDSEVEPIKVLDQVWLSVTNVPTPLRAFLPLWAVGSVVDATQKVDMNHLRLTGEVRILVAVFDVKEIPKMADISINRSIYRVYFNVEEVVDDDPFNPEDDDLLGDDADTGMK
ncbi:uncharacterized protein LOC120683001 isoform X2 [Panicum virgatum]|uniref:Eukaryotic translation initiation factor 3 subunit G N-terminal domain-containing protein n=1 Tax=Panicum virgatum TaxID=38727 RepID=A0A8T0PXG4_PANVG|nr:uncharacterized protein LOC120683001 isoform X2 [Panicum virgatum]KAG2565608.1 hypothetical protein PVAP13_7NG100034 [Panicum virgatum]